MLRITHASGSETDQLRAMLRPGRLYVIDRGYLDHGLYREILEAALVVHWTHQGQRLLYGGVGMPAHYRPTVRQVSSVMSGLKRVGTPHHKNELKGYELRLIKVQRTNDEGAVGDVVAAYQQARPAC